CDALTNILPDELMCGIKGPVDGKNLDVVRTLKTEYTVLVYFRTDMKGQAQLSIQRLCRKLTQRLNSPDRSCIDSYDIERPALHQTAHIVGTRDLIPAGDRNTRAVPQAAITIDARAVIHILDPRDSQTFQCRQVSGMVFPGGPGPGEIQNQLAAARP